MRLAWLMLLLWIAPAMAQPARVEVVASFSVLADMVREVGGDAVAVTSLVGPDGDAHVYQPTPADAQAVARARLVVANGLGLDDWTIRLAEAAGYRGRIVVAAERVTPILVDGRPDPHAWQAVRNAALYAAAVAEGLAAADPDRAADYRQRRDDYVAALDALDRWIRQAIDAVPPAQRRIITTHDAFRYFGQSYGVAFLAPIGMSEDSEPSAAAVSALIRQIRQDGTRALFIENMTDPRLIRQLAQEAGAEIGGTLFADALSRPGEGGETYIAMMHHNVAAMVAAMRKN
jgi:zinc/manganese transport system substrate-binding protein